MEAEPFKRVLQDTVQRAMDNLPPQFPSIIGEIVKTRRITVENEREAMAAAMRIRMELHDAYVRVHDAFSQPMITVAVFKDVKNLEKETWHVIAREMKRVG